MLETARETQEDLVVHVLAVAHARMVYGAHLSPPTFCCSGEMVQEGIAEAGQGTTATAALPSRAGELRASHHICWHRR